MKLPADFGLQYAEISNRAPHRSAAWSLLFGWVLVLAGGVLLIEERWDPFAWLRSTVIARITAPGELAQASGWNRSPAAAAMNQAHQAAPVIAKAAANAAVPPATLAEMTAAVPSEAAVASPDAPAARRRVWRSLGRHGSQQIGASRSVAGLSGVPAPPVSPSEQTDIDREFAEDERAEVRLLRRQSSFRSRERAGGAPVRRELIGSRLNVAEPAESPDADLGLGQDSPAVTQRPRMPAARPPQATDKRLPRSAPPPQLGVQDSGAGATVSKGLGCDAAFRAAEQTIDMRKASTPDVPRSAYARILSDGSILNGCGISERAEVNICVTIKQGRALGTTVSVSHGGSASARCVARRVHGKRFPRGEQPDRVRTRFAPQR